MNQLETWRRRIGAYKGNEDSQTLGDEGQRSIQNDDGQRDEDGQEGSLDRRRGKGKHTTLGI